MTIQTTDLPTPINPPEPIPPLRHGDRLTRAEFERRYTAMPHVKKAELLEGVVYMPSPVSRTHGYLHFDLVGWLGIYRVNTPGVEGGDNSTIRLDLDSEPQPDAHIRILATHGGQARVDEDDFVTGAPELVAEVAARRTAVDLRVKLPMYARNGVREYIVWRALDQEIDWFVLRGTTYEPLPLTPEGHYRSEGLPGLWLDPAALIRGDMLELSRVAQLGIASAEHAAFVQRLAETVAARAGAALTHKPITL